MGALQGLVDLGGVTAVEAVGGGDQEVDGSAGAAAPVPVLARARAAERVAVRVESGLGSLVTAGSAGDGVFAQLAAAGIAHGPERQGDAH